ncbi:MAG: hypothetical protein WA317_08035, partial [Mycobacterium sp.]
PRRTFSSGQRALLWAAGVLGALAIIIAVLIVVNSHNESTQQQSPPTVTDTGTPPAKSSGGASTAPAQPSSRTGRHQRGHRLVFSLEQPHPETLR